MLEDVSTFSSLTFIELCIGYPENVYAGAPLGPSNVMSERVVIDVLFWANRGAVSERDRASVVSEDHARPSATRYISMRGPKNYHKLVVNTRDRRKKP